MNAEVCECVILELQFYSAVYAGLGSAVLQNG